MPCRAFLVVAVAASATLGGCYYTGDVEPDPDLLVAGPTRAPEAIAMAEARLGAKAKPVYWYGPDAMTCDDGTGFPSPEGCVLGITGANGSIVSWDGVSPPSGTPLAHELVHQARGDFGHADLRLWGASRGDYDYEPGTIVGDLNAALSAAGM